ncbi:MAG: sigma-70 family RNA polymerase sigma factor [Lentisphaeraceae bacterium]|nr:sigma-70 family RNA polymerase sigma factor [Lentisphaeraceae bacterium]
MNQTRLTLLQKLRDRHDEEAWEDFVKYYERFVWAVLLQMKLSQHDCDDIKQVVMLKAWKVLPEFNYETSKGKFRNWLAVITRNEARSFLRKKYRSFDLEGGERQQQLKDLSDSWQDPEIEKISKDEWKKYIITMAWENISSSLSSKVKKCYEMLNEAISISEIACSLSIQENSVYVYRKRVEKQMMKEILRLEEQLG